MRTVNNRQAIGMVIRVSISVNSHNQGTAIKRPLGVVQMVRLQP